MSNQQNGNLRVQKILNQLSEEKTSDYNAFGSVEGVAADKIFAVKTAYTKCTALDKVNLGIGAYRDEKGKPYVLGVVKEAELYLAEQYKEKKDSKDSNDSKDSKDSEGCTKEYQGIPGDAEFIKLSQRLMLEPETLRAGKSEATHEKLKKENNCMAGVQSLSGTGALRVLFAFIKNTLAKDKKINVFVSNPTWGNHQKIIRDAGLAPNGDKNQVKTYPYIGEDKVSLDIKAMLNCLKNEKNSAEKPMPGDIILLHACAHNPTGVDPSEEEWHEIRKVMKKRELVPFFDCAYQGFASGNLEKDSKAVREFAKDGFDFLLAQSYAKNLGLYGERIGCASVMCKTKEIAAKVQTQLNGVVRPMYSNPPRHGMEIVKFVLSKQEKFAKWEQELLKMSGRIQTMRTRLVQELNKKNALPNPPCKDWSHITKQIGMFSFTGLNEDQAKACFKPVPEDYKEGDELTNKRDVFLLDTGRISMAGLNEHNVEKVAKVFKEVLTDESLKKEEPKKKAEKEQQ